MHPRTLLCMFVSRIKQLTRGAITAPVVNSGEWSAQQRRTGAQKRKLPLLHLQWACWKRDSDARGQANSLLKSYQSRCWSPQCFPWQLWVHWDPWKSNVECSGCETEMEQSRSLSITSWGAICSLNPIQFIRGYNQQQCGTGDKINHRDVLSLLSFCPFNTKHFFWSHLPPPFGHSCIQTEAQQNKIFVWRDFSERIFYFFPRGNKHLKECSSSRDFLKKRQWWEIKGRFIFLSKMSLCISMHKTWAAAEELGVRIVHVYVSHLTSGYV